MQARRYGEVPSSRCSTTAECQVIHFPSPPNPNFANSVMHRLRFEIRDGESMRQLVLLALLLIRLGIDFDLRLEAVRV